ADLKQILAANELVTEKNEKKRAYWENFLGDFAKAASIALAIGAITNFVTPTPAEAAQNKATNEQNNPYYVKSKINLGTG
ncbi:MAG TPA: hypothetical protein PLF11_15030, partial [Bacillota bacterium]|nr:hypothetical protein [Bacillota bacterium]